MDCDEAMFQVVDSRLLGCDRRLGGVRFGFVLVDGGGDPSSSSSLPTLLSTRKCLSLAFVIELFTLWVELLDEVAAGIMVERAGLGRL